MEEKDDEYRSNLDATHAWKQPGSMLILGTDADTSNEVSVRGVTVTAPM